MQRKLEPELQEFLDFAKTYWGLCPLHQETDIGWTGLRNAIIERDRNAWVRTIGYWQYIHPRGDGRGFKTYKEFRREWPTHIMNEDISVYKVFKYDS